MNPQSKDSQIQIVARGLLLEGEDPRPQTHRSFRDYEN